MTTPVVTRRRTSATREALVGYAMLAPALTVLAIFAYYPLYRLVRLSLYRPNRFGTGEVYVGFSNIVDVLGGDEFRSALWITVKLLIYTVPVGVVLGTLLALAAHRRLRGIKFFQTVFASTIATSAAIAGVIFYTLINPKIGRIGDVSFLSLSKSSSALFGVSLSLTWQNIGLTFVIVLAGLQAVPDQVIEAARLDGWGPVRRLFRITLPLISPTLLFLIVILIVGAFQAFAQIEFLTAGGPAGSTETIVFKVFQRQSPANISEGAVMALGLFGLTFAVTMFQLSLLNKRVHYGD
jgi:sn-glycerol 3-phosphate transport system permease protein